MCATGSDVPFQAYLSSATISDKDKLEGWRPLSSFGHGAGVK